MAGVESAEQVIATHALDDELERDEPAMAGDAGIERKPPLFVREQLSTLGILQGVSESAAWGVLEHCALRQLEPADVLLTKGQPNRCMYFLIEGRLGIHLEEPPS
ncbi:MAG TPA: hypothetical protein VIV60_37290, partial [Polyangiaceae bacterium]